MSYYDDWLASPYENQADPPEEHEPDPPTWECSSCKRPGYAGQTKNRGLCWPCYVKYLETKGLVNSPGR